MPRKKRNVKGAFVDTADITSEPGKYYRNWINPSQIKLKQRERLLFARKIEAIEDSVNMELDKIGKRYNIDFSIKQTPNKHQEERKQSVIFKIDSQTIEEWLQYLFQPINRWKGINVYRVRKSMTRFVDYFNEAKNWWDQMKIGIYGQYIFPNTFQMIYDCVYNQIVVRNNNNNNNNNKIMFELILRSIFKHIFNKTVTYPATKALSVIPAGCLKITNKINKIHQFLYNKVSISFNAEFWKNKGIYKNVRAGILKAVQCKLCELTNETQQLLMKYMSNSAVIPHPTSLPISSQNQAHKKSLILDQQHVIKKPVLSSNVCIIPRSISPNITSYTILCPWINFGAQIIVDHAINNQLRSNYNNNYQHTHSNYVPSYSHMVSSDYRWSPLMHCNTNN